MESQGFCSDTEVLSESAADALAWYQSVKAGNETARKDFDWLALAKGAALRARVCADEESLAWAMLSTSAFRVLSDEQPEGGHDLGEMYCRVAMIEKHGCIANDALCDPDTIFEWFRAKVPLDAAATLGLVDRLMDEITDQFVTEVVNPLKDVKARLTVIRALPKSCEIPEDLAEFSRLYHQLP